MNDLSNPINQQTPDIHLGLGRVSKLLFLFALVMMVSTACMENQDNSDENSGFFDVNPTRKALIEADSFYHEAISGTRESPQYSELNLSYEDRFPDAINGLMEVDIRNGYCTGFSFIYRGQTILLTASHCEEPTPSISLSQSHLEDGINNIFGGVEYEYVDEGYDLRLIKFNKSEPFPSSNFAVIKNIAQLNDVVDVFIPSFPRKNYFLATGLQLSFDWPSGLGERIEDLYHLPGIPGEMGTSGAPVFGVFPDGSVKLIGMSSSRAVNVPYEAGGVMQVVTKETLDKMLSKLETEN